MNFLTVLTVISEDKAEQADPYMQPLSQLWSSRPRRYVQHS